jgi:O-antigen/teichoic acid export membrane protein
MGWSYSGVIVGILLQLAGSIMFARILGAQVMGIFAFGLLVFAPFKFICEFGLGSALVTRPVLTDEDVSLALSSSTLLTVILAPVWLLSIRPMAAIIHQEENVAALNCFALALLCLPIQSICTGLLTKQLDQKYLQVSSLVAYAAGYLTFGAYGTLHDWGVWSLIAGFVAQNAIATAMLFLHSRPSLALRFKGDASLLWGFGARAAAINISNWLTSSLDNMAVAWFFGTRTLGIYSVAYGLVRSPADRIVATLQNVLFPASALALENKERLIKGCVATIDAAFSLTAPAFCAVALLASTIVQAAYGDAWYQAAWILPPFALSMIFYCLTVIISALLWGTGGVHRDARLQWYSAVAFLGAVIIAAQFSFVAVAWTVLPITAVRAAWGIRLLTITVEINVRRVLRGFLAGAVLAAMIAPALFLLDALMRRFDYSALIRLTWEGAMGVLLWFSLITLLRTRILTIELQTGLKSMRASWESAKNHA